METIRDIRWEALKAAARGLGDSHGRAAASWFDIPDKRAARRILMGIQDCDPAVMDELPGAALSGGCTDSYTPNELYRDLGVPANVDSDDQELCGEYEAAWCCAVENDIAGRARRILED